MEYGLRVVGLDDPRTYVRTVLILVLMEYGLRVLPAYLIGQWLQVLILVLMEYGLRDYGSGIVIVGLDES